jgi:hypothetical protein
MSDHDQYASLYFTAESVHDPVVGRKTFHAAVALVRAALQFNSKHSHGGTEGRVSRAVLAVRWAL